MFESVVELSFILVLFSLGRNQNPAIFDIAPMSVHDTTKCNSFRRVSELSRPLVLSPEKVRCGRTVVLCGGGQDSSSTRVRIRRAMLAGTKTPSLDCRLWICSKSLYRRGSPRILRSWRCKVCHGAHTCGLCTLERLLEGHLNEISDTLPCAFGVYK